MDKSKIEEKLDEVNSRLNNIDNTLTAQHEILKNHIKRTELLEVQVDTLKSNSNQIIGAVKFVKIIGIVFGILAGLAEIISMVSRHL